MAWTQDDKDAVDEAIASGVLTVKLSSPAGTRERTFRSLNELLQIRALIDAELRGHAAANFTVAVVSRGLRRVRDHE